MMRKNRIKKRARCTVLRVFMSVFGARSLIIQAPMVSTYARVNANARYSQMSTIILVAKSTHLSIPRGLPIGTIQRTRPWSIVHGSLVNKFKAMTASIIALIAVGSVLPASPRRTRFPTANKMATAACDYLRR
jgi:hypothetical protein